MALDCCDDPETTAEAEKGTAYSDYEPANYQR